MINDLRYAFRTLLKDPGFTAVALLAAFIPARRAVRADPLATLRYE